MEQALARIDDGDHFTIVHPDHWHPRPCWAASGSSHTELLAEFQALAGEHIGFGRDPFDSDSAWMEHAPDQVLVLKL